MSKGYYVDSKLRKVIEDITGKEYDDKMSNEKVQEKVAEDLEEKLESLERQLSTYRTNAINKERDDSDTIRIMKEAHKKEVAGLKQEIEENIEDAQDVIIREPETWGELFGLVVKKLINKLK